MPDLSTIYPSTVPAEGAFAGMVQGQQFLDAQANQEANQRAALQDYLFKQQKNPIDLQQAQANVGHTQALTRQSNVTADATQLQNDWENRTKDEKYKTWLEEQAGKHDEASIKASLVQAQKLMWSGNPVDVKRGKMMYDMSMDVLKATQQQNAQYKQAIDVANTMGRYKLDAAEASHAGGNKTPTNAQGMANKYFELARAEQDPEKRAEYLAIANQFQTQAQLAPNKAPAIVIGADGRATTNPNVPAPVPLNLSPAMAPPGGNLGQPKTPQEAQKAGWVLMQDAAGRKAYVSPDKKQHIEIQ